MLPREALKPQENLHFAMTAVERGQLTLCDAADRYNKLLRTLRNHFKSGNTLRLFSE